MPIIAPSILAADWANLEKEVRAVETSGADWLHLDVMDGRFVPPITFGPKLVKSVKDCSSIPLDVHLMIVEPEKHIESFVDAGADSIIIHSEAVSQLDKVLKFIKSTGAKTGVALNPDSSLDPVIGLLGEIDILLLMTVHPGWGGQPFTETVISKIKHADSVIKKEKLGTQIEVDGGINAETAKWCVESGAEILVAGSSVFNSDSYSDAIKGLRGQ